MKNKDIDPITVIKKRPSSSKTSLDFPKRTKSSVSNIFQTQNLLSKVPENISSIPLKKYCPSSIVPYPFQIEVLQQIFNLWKSAYSNRKTDDPAFPSNIGIYNASDQGTGKTLESILAINILNHFHTHNNARKNLKTLVIVPASLRWNWEKEIRSFTTLKPVSIRTIYRQKDCLPSLSADYIITSYDMLRNKTVWKFICEEDFDCMIVDEMQNCSNIFTKRTKLVMNLYTRCGFNQFLSGTPIRSSAENLYPGLKCLDYGAVAPYLNYTYPKFCAHFCKTKTVPVKSSGGYRKTIETYYGSKNDHELVQIMQPYFVRKSKEQVLSDLPPKNFQQIELNVALPAGVTETKLSKQQIEKLLQDLDSACTEDNEAKIKHILQRNQAFATIRRELALNKTKGEGGDFILDLLETGQQLVVFAYHKDVIHELSGRLRDRNIKHGVLHGAVDQKKRKEVISAFISAGSQCLIAQIQVGGVGLNLQESCSTCVFLETSFTPTDIMQAVDRLHRIGQKNPVTAYFLSGKNRFDAGTDKILVEKLKTFISLVKDT